MDLSKIIHIQGTQGLHRIISQTEKVVIAESLLDKKRVPITNGYGLIMLEGLTIFSHDNQDGIHLTEVLKAIHEKVATEPLPDKKANDFVVKDYFRACVPSYDEAKVYPSIIRKLFSWYLLLKDTGFNFEETEEEMALKEGEASDSPQ